MRHLLLLLGLIPALAFADPIETVKTPAGPGSLAPGLSVSPEGPVLTWLEPDEDGHALRLSVFADGAFGPARTIAYGADWFANWADTPALFVLPGGDWLAHWLEKSGPGTYSYDIRLTRSSDGGRSWSEPVTPHDDGTPTEHGFVSYYAVDDHTAGLFWLDGRNTASDEEQSHHDSMTLRTARIDREGSLGGEIELDSKVCDCCQTDTALTDAGPVVVYRDRGNDEVRDIHVRRQIDGDWQPPVAVHDDGWQIAACPVNGPAMVAHGMRVVVTWFTMADNHPRVMLATSSDGGASFEAPVEVATGTTQGRVDLIWLESGELLLTWLGQGALWLARFDENLEELGRQSLTAIDSGRISGFPRLAALDDGGVLVAWTASVDGRSQVRVGRIKI